MKRVFLIAVVLLMIKPTAFANEENEPNKNITESFKADFPLASQISWTKNDNGDFIAKFTQDGQSHHAYYSESGEYLGQGWYTKLKDVSDNVQQSIITFSRSAEIKTVYIFLPPAGFPKHYTTINRKNKLVILRTDAYGETTIVDEKKLPFKN